MGLHAYNGYLIPSMKIIALEYFIFIVQFHCVSWELFAKIFHEIPLEDLDTEGHC